MSRDRFKFDLAGNVTAETLQRILDADAAEFGHVAARVLSVAPRPSGVRVVVTIPATIRDVSTNEVRDVDITFDLETEVN